jgi:hypothetical protein
MASAPKTRKSPSNFDIHPSFPDAHHPCPDNKTHRANDCSGLPCHVDWRGQRQASPERHSGDGMPGVGWPVASGRGGAASPMNPRGTMCRAGPPPPGHQSPAIAPSGSLGRNRHFRLLLASDKRIQPEKHLPTSLVEQDVQHFLGLILENWQGIRRWIRWQKVNWSVPPQLLLTRNFSGCYSYIKLLDIM